MNALRTRIARFSIASALVLGLGVLGTAPVLATELREDGIEVSDSATTSDSSDVRAADSPEAVLSLAPACVALKQWTGSSWNHARATNLCGYQVRILMVWDWAVDGGCTSLAPGWSFTEGRSKSLPTRVSSLVNC